MSGSVGGEIAAACIGAAVVAPFLVAAGVAVGIAKTHRFLEDVTYEKWAASERIQEVKRQEAALKEARHLAYREVRAEYDEVCAGLELDRAAGVSVDIPDAPPDLTPDATLTDFQQTIGELRLKTADLRLTRESATTLALARKTAEALEHRSDGEALLAADNLAQRARRLEAERRDAQAAGNASTVAAADRELAQLTSDRLASLADAERQRISAALVGLSSELTPAARERLDAWLTGVPTLEGTQLTTAAAAIEGICREANATAASRRLHAEVSAGVLTGLDGCTTQVATEIKRRAKAGLDGDEPWDPELVVKARLEQERWAAEATDFIASAIIAESLSEVGCSVGEDFVVDSMKDVAYAEHAQSPKHAIQVDISGADGRLTMSVIRRGKPAATPIELAEDVEAERVFCHSTPAIEEASRARDLEIDIDFREEPGSSPLVAVPELEESTRIVHRPTPREREMPL